MTSTIIFVYNANSGLFNTVTDIAHKIFSPGTYACNLCALTHSPFGMRKQWKEFLAGLGRPMEFLHADELRRQYGISGVPLPAVYVRREGVPELCIDAPAINQCKTLEELERLIRERVGLNP